jgi:superfamily II DNA or RNA helicase/HKD family nuclease
MGGRNGAPVHHMTDDDLPLGLYEGLLTGELRTRIEKARKAGRYPRLQPIEDGDLADVLARHILEKARESISAMPLSLPDRRAKQVDLANRLVHELYTPYGDGSPAEVDAAANLLIEVAASSEPSLPTPRPSISLRDSVLLTNGRGDFQIGTQLALEIQSANQIDLLSAFIRFAGIRLIRKELQEFLLRGGSMRVIASVYTGSTEKRALDELVGLGAKVKVSYETAQTRLHAKAWLFERNSGYHTAYVGSSNLTHSALLEGLEWNVRATIVDNRQIIERIDATFEQYWQEPEFESYDPRVDGDRLQAALDAERHRTSGELVLVGGRSGARAKPFQDQILEALDAERRRDHRKNLIVAPTGTGKTWVSAFDYARLRAEGYERLLFVAHRDEILRQSQEVFRKVLDDAAFGERYIGTERPERWDHVFASIQSLHRGLDRVDPGRFDVIIVDEFHRAEAPTYRRLLGYLRPKVLIGLTATPERADGQEILHWFDDRIASEMRLWDALDQGLLCPFHYLGVNDGTDLRGVGFQRGRYVTSELDDVLTGDHVRATRIIEAVREWVLDPTQMRALGFCVGVAHAHFMAQQFNEAGLAAVALDGETDSGTRRDAVDQLRRGALQVIFTVDLFNEGVDIPEVDTLLLLRPTESATIFLQQLGRGLRWSPGKSVLTVLDFIGQAHAEYRFDVKFRALLGGTRRQLERTVGERFPLMPPGCAIHLDEISQRIILDNLKSTLKSTRRLLVEDLRSLPPATRLPEFLEASSFDLQDVYSNPSGGATFTSALRSAGHIRNAPSSAESEFGKAIGKMLHIDDDQRFDLWTSWLLAHDPPAHFDPDTHEGRLLLMLFAALGQRKKPLADLRTALQSFWQCSSLKAELIDLLGVLRERARLDSLPIDRRGILPLQSHATYSLYEIIAAYNLVNNGVMREIREGVIWMPAAATDLLLITLNKSDVDFSPTTRYQDYPVSPTLFQWESQSGTATNSPTGQRYINHSARGSRVVLFVREDRRDDRNISNPYLCLGLAHHVSHKHDRPMQIIWELERPMPAVLFQRAKVAAG